MGEDTVISALLNSKKDLTYIYIVRDGEILYEPISTSEIQDIIKNELNKGDTYKERVIEVKTGGKYLVAEDGTEIALPNATGKTKIYIFYTKV